MKTSLISNNPSLANPDILAQICSPLKTLGVSFFGYTAVDINGNAYCLGSKPDYAEEYLRRNHVHNDVHYRTNNFNKNFYYDFWDYLELDKRTQELYRMAAAFNQGHTLTITQHTENLTHCFHFSSDLANQGINQKYLEKMDCLHSFIYYFKDCLVTIPEIADVYNNPVRINNSKRISKKIYFNCLNQNNYTNIAEIASKTLYFKDQKTLFLTKKELDCLKWLHLGKSAALIAEIKDVTSKTVERYIESCKKKYNCRTLYQLGERIAETGLVKFLDLL